MKTYGEMEVQLHHYSPWHQMEVSGKLHVFGLYPRGKSPRRLGGPQGRSEHYGEEKNFLPLLGIEP
jgi:hypothetical protein